MEISLLLHSVSQDQKASSEDIAFYGWMHGPASGGDGDDNLIAASKTASHQSRLPKYSLRKESWGGILVFGPTQAVYQLDNEAFEFMVRVKAGESPDEISKKLNAVDVNTVNAFVAMASKFGVI
ncbi:hypothetical protein ACK33E_06470 [Aeromonas hydrophila]|uniref:hypothetical protein n=1 Tax=Aeromonas hydrophila TaxID=644 RepID=UPI0039891258